MPHARLGRNTQAYRRARARLKRNGPHICWLCGHEINTELDYRHPLSFTADHVDPLSTGGHVLGELKPAHRSCNSRRGNGTTTSTERQPTSNAW